MLIRPREGKGHRDPCLFFIVTFSSSSASPLSLIVQGNPRVLRHASPGGLALSFSTPAAVPEVPEIAAWLASCPGYPPQHEDIGWGCWLQWASNVISSPCQYGLIILSSHGSGCHIDHGTCRDCAAKRGTPPGPGHRDSSKLRVRAPDILSVASSHSLSSWSLGVEQRCAVHVAHISRLSTNGDISSRGCQEHDISFPGHTRRIKKPRPHPAPSSKSAREAAQPFHTEHRIQTGAFLAQTHTLQPASVSAASGRWRKTALTRTSCR